ncbi:MAG: hypothetical protein JNK53_02605, partial [Phycisphaerae bacterium]|nr:hypothetical protein [Phycisphaerae bacterium]
DMDVEVQAVLDRPSLGASSAELRAKLEPLRAAYRAELAVSASALADALLEFPTDRLKELRAAGLSEDVISGYVRGGNRGNTAEDRDAIASAVRRSQRRILRAQVAIDDLNVRTAAQWAPLLPAAAAEVFQSESAFRRADPDSGQVMVRWFLEAIEVLPEVRSGRAPRVTAALQSVRKATDEYAVAVAAAWRRSATDAGGTMDAANDETVKRAAKSVEDARKAATQVVEEALSTETMAQLRSLVGMTAPDARTTLEQLVGRAQASRLMTRAPRTMFLAPVPQEEEFDNKRSLALQILLGPLASRQDFDRISEVLGAAHDDPIVEQLWQRYSERAEQLTKTQEESLRALEERTQQSGGSAGEDPAAFERDVADYLRALMAADAARGQLMVDTLEDLAAGRGVRSDDARLVVARAQLAVARSAVPWRRFQLPWLVGCLTLAQADCIAIAAAAAPDDPISTAAALNIAVQHAPNLEQTSMAARSAGFESLRGFVSLVLKLQRTARDQGMSPEEIPTLPEAQALARRTRAAAQARMDAQAQFMSALEPVLGPDCSASMRAAYAAATFPEFFSEHTWLRTSRDLASAVTAGRNGVNSISAALAESVTRWRDADAAVIARLLAWMRSADAQAPAARLTSLQALAIEDAELAALRTLRDESALRLLRDAAVLANEPPNSRMPGAVRLVSRPPVTLSP